MSHASDASGYATLGWGVFLILALTAILIVAGLPLGPITVLGGVVAVLFAYAYPYIALGLMALLIPFLGIFVHIPADALSIGARVFGGSIDFLLGELVAYILLIVWGMKVIALWISRGDSNWKPWFPLFGPMLLVVAAHLLTIWSPFQPDALLVIKYTIRPVLFCYLIYVALPVNFIRSRRRLKSILGIVVATGIFSALIGFVSLFSSQNAGQLFPRATPLPMFGVHPIGDNHNVLAEWLAVCVPATMALWLLVSSSRIKRLLVLAAVFQVMIGLLTFARTYWIVFAAEVFLAGWLVWREQLRRFVPYVGIGLLLLLPLGALMAAFSSTALVASSTSTRFMMAEIAISLWQQSPWIGAGAGTFVDRIGSTALFTIEYGNPLDAHGWLQKLFAETGVIGFAAVAWFVWSAFQLVRSSLRSTFTHAQMHVERTVILFLSIGAIGALIYQLFNTNYWTGKMWFALGLLIAATRALASSHASYDDAERS
ncbi:MAG: hypothetical protein KIH65_000205 [Candidatus Uhrbacteria bacterium]|nr:hypothetical protein [Candidatus Uhrbacteria bacterium]